MGDLRLIGRGFRGARGQDSLDGIFNWSYEVKTLQIFLPP